MKAVEEYPFVLLFRSLSDTVPRLIVDILYSTSESFQLYDGEDSKS